MKLGEKPERLIEFAGIDWAGPGLWWFAGFGRAGCARRAGGGAAAHESAPPWEKPALDRWPDPEPMQRHEITRTEGALDINENDSTRAKLIDPRYGNPRQ